jgi:iron complex outermembrane receptor protein
MIVSLRLCTAGILFGGFLVLASRVGAQVAALVSPTGNTVGSADPLLERVIRVDLTDASVPDAADVIARNASARISYSRELLGNTRVSLHRRAITVGAALAEVLGDSGLEPTVSSGDFIVLSPRSAANSSPLSGTVADEAAGTPLEGASVLVGGKVARVTDYAGSFAGLRLPPGPGVILVRKIGYVARAIPVPDDSSARIHLRIALAPAPLALDRIVVMGALSGSAEQSLPSAVTVLSGTTLQDMQLRTIDDLFRGFIPGVVGWDDGPSALTSHLGSVRGAASFSINYFKTYVDGVEVAAPFLGSMIDPSTIERVEIIRGPQGAALHGSDASSGVIQIVTRDGRGSVSGRPHFAVSVGEGTMQSRFVPAAPRTQELSGSMGGANEKASFLVGGKRQTTGEFVKGASAKQSSAYGKLHTEMGVASADLELQQNDIDGGGAINPILVQLGVPILHAVENPVRVAQHRTAGGTVHIAPWSQVNFLATAGYDRSSLEGVGTPVPFISPADSVLVAARGAAERKSLRLATDITQGSVGRIGSSLSLGFDASHLRHASDAVYNEGRLISPAGVEFESSRGVFSQANASFDEIIFLTAGLREEWNTSFGNAYGAARLPLLGASIVSGIGPLTLKTRASYGKGIRPPPIDADRVVQLTELTQRANPQLAPESQSGTELGLDAYFDRWASIKLTRYDQLAEGLIQQVLVDEISRPRVVQQQNIGTIRNAGWELEANSDIAWLSLLANYARTASRVRSIAPRYTGTLRPGDRMLEVPSWTASGTTTAGGSDRSLSLTVWRVGDWINYDWISLYTAVLKRDPNRGPPRSYWIRYPGFTQIRASARQKVWRSSEMFIRGDNLTNVQNAGRDNLHVNTGRTITIGVSATY